MILTKLILAGTFIFVFLQDYKERQVYWFLFPIIAFLCGFLFYKNTLPKLFFYSFAMNIVFLLSLVLIVFLYSKLKLKTHLLNTIGLGDLLLFLAVSVSFSTITFIILFIGALIFSLVLHLILSKNQKVITVPLAGYMSLFFLMSYLFHWTGLVTIVYTL